MRLASTRPRVVAAVWLLVLVLAACASGPPPAATRSAPAPFVGQDLRDYYPDLARYTTQYLEGDNYGPGGPRFSVLWFERQDDQTFRIYNSDPTSADARCNYDELSWWKDGLLRYVRTVTACRKPTTTIEYDPPIIFLPQQWTGRPWRLNGQSTARSFVDGVLRCQGTNAWVAQIVGVEQGLPGDVELHWSTTQTTTWTSGSVPGLCYKGGVTHWREDYWLTARLADPGGVRQGKALWRTMGGNLDRPDLGWDIRMARWAPLPRA